MLPEERNGVPPVASFLVGVKDENVRASIRVTLWGRMQQQKLSCSNRVFWSSYDAAHRSSKIHVNIHEESNMKNKPVLFTTEQTPPSCGPGRCTFSVPIVRVYSYFQNYLTTVCYSHFMLALVQSKAFCIPGCPALR